MGFSPTFGSRRFPKGEWKALSVRPQAHISCRGGHDAPTTARVGTCHLMGFSPTFGARRFPKGNEGKRVIQWIQPPKAVSAPEFRQTTSGAHGSAGRADCLPRGKPFGAPAGAYLLPRGADAPTTARTVGLPPRGESEYFLSKRKKVPREKASGTATTGKSPLLPIFERGSSQCRAQTSWIAISYCRARSCSLFSSFKKGEAFSLRCLSPLCSPAAGVGQTQPMRIGMFWRGLGGFAAQNSRLGFCSTVGINNHAQTTQLGCFDAAWIFSQHKRPAGFHIHAGLYCEP